MMHPWSDWNYAPAGKARQYSKLGIGRQASDTKGGDREKSRFAASSPASPCPHPLRSSDAGSTAHKYDNTPMKPGHLPLGPFPPGQWFRRE